MSWTVLLLFVPACFALNLAPGPNNLLSVSFATRYGFHKAIVAGAGRLTAFVVMITLASAGLAAALYTSQYLFTVIKVAGAAYLFYLAIQLWRADPAAKPETSAAETKLLALARQEFLVAAGNPKAILIFTAFLPQFVDPSRPAAAQFFILGTLFLVLELTAIVLYSWIGAYMRRWFDDPQCKRVFNRACSALLMSAGIGLLLSRSEETA